MVARGELIKTSDGRCNVSPEKNGRLHRYNPLHSTVLRPQTMCHEDSGVGYGTTRNFDEILCRLDNTPVGPCRIAFTYCWKIPTPRMLSSLDNAHVIDSVNVPSLFFDGSPADHYHNLVNSRFAIIIVVPED